MVRTQLFVNNLFSFFDVTPARPFVFSVKTYCVDLTDFGELRAVMEGLPVMDGVVNNAGVGMHAPFLEATEEQVNMFRNIFYVMPLVIVQV